MSSIDLLASPQEKRKGVNISHSNKGEEGMLLIDRNVP